MLVRNSKGLLFANIPRLRLNTGADLPRPRLQLATSTILLVLEALKLLPGIAAALRVLPLAWLPPLDMSPRAILLLRQLRRTMVVLLVASRPMAILVVVLVGLRHPGVLELETILLVELAMLANLGALIGGRKFRLGYQLLEKHTCSTFYSCCCATLPVGVVDWEAWLPAEE